MPSQPQRDTDSIAAMPSLWWLNLGWGPLACPLTTLSLCPVMLTPPESALVLPFWKDLTP